MRTQRPCVFPALVNVRTHVCGLRHPTADLRWLNFFQPSEFSVDIHLNSLVIRFFWSQSEKIAVALRTSDVTNRSRIHVNNQT